jgi:hypothetical protein
VTLLHTVGHDARSSRRRSLRDDRLTSRRALWGVTSLDRVRSCGHHAITPDGAIRVRATGTGPARRAGFAGYASCGSVWACPVCSERVLASRQHELESAITTWEATGGRVALVTLTMRHHAGQALADLWDGLSHAWAKTTSGRGWRDLNDRHGSPMERRVTSGARRGQVVTERRIGWARVVETTHGANGWHVHVHCAMFLPATTTRDGADDLGGRMFATWARALRARGFAAPLAGPGVDVRLSGSETSAALAKYFVKATYSSEAARLALEVARGDLKHARGQNRTPFRILADFAAHGVVDDLDLWHEWETASRGRRQLTWATGFRAVVLAEPERTDEDLAADELGSADDDLVELPRETVCALADLAGLQALVLEAAEDDDSGVALRRYLTGRGLAFTDVRPRPGPRDTPLTRAFTR